MIKIKYLDIRRSLTSVISKLGIDIFYENITEINRPCFYIELVDYLKEFDSNYRELKQLDFDIIYFPRDKEGNNSETIEALEELDNNFEVEGNKILVVTNKQGEKRFLLIKDVRMHIVDNRGHYEFSIDLYDGYGKPIDYELMQELHLNFNKEEK